MTRIIAGRARSVRLGVPKSGTRPTSDRVREALFSSLDSLGVLAGARVLDLYAGSGALGLEAASRGAAQVTLVERDAGAVKVMRANMTLVQEALSQEPPCELDAVKSSVASFLTGEQRQWDLVFLDPPYELSEGELADAVTRSAELLDRGGLLVVERSVRSPEPAWPSRITDVREKRYGETSVWFAS